jgi:quinoprotein glucose dehydrogenase
MGLVAPLRRSGMFETAWRFRRYVAVLAGLAAGVGALTTSTAQSDKWWPGYGNGPDNSRYFASRQINKSNVNRLRVAWTYPHGDTGSVPIAVRGVLYGHGRNGSLSS